MIKRNDSSSVRNMEEKPATSTQQYRHAVDAVRRLDEVLLRTKSCQDLFLPDVSSIRIKLKELCERLILCENTTLGTKAEEFLWRKVYYEVINYVKQHRKKWDNHTDATIKLHIMSGIGTYHLLVRRFNLLSQEEFEKGNPSTKNSRITKSLFKFHIALGDLTRYQADFSDRDLRLIAENYYKEAVILNPDAGLPFNQLGTLYAGYSYGLDSVYYYMRGLLTEHPFEGTEPNLLRLLERNRKSYAEVALNSTHSNQISRVRKFIVCFLRLVDIFYSCPESDSGLSDLCQEMLQDLPECLPVHKNLLSMSTLEYIPQHLNPDLAFRIIVILEMCFIRLQLQGNMLTSAAVAFLFAFMSHIVFYSISACNTLLPQLLQNFSPSETSKFVNLLKESETNATGNKVQKHARPLRRRKRETSNNEDSDLSEGENAVSLCSSIDSEIEANDSIDGEEDLEVLSESGETPNAADFLDTTDARLNASAELALQVVELALEENTPLTASENNVDSIELTSSSEHDTPSLECNTNILHILCQRGYLFSIKNFCDWLKSSPEFLKNCAASSQLLWSRIVTLVNILQDQVSSFLSEKIRPDVLPGLIYQNAGDAGFQCFPLPEDVLMQNFPGLEELQMKFDFTMNQKISLNNYEQVALRIQCLHQFCKFLVHNCTDIGITFDESSQTFTTPNGQEELTQNISWIAPGNENDNENKKEMMQNMTQLWLKAEVSDLESKVQVNSSKAFSLYLVPHSAVLVHHLPSVKHLTSAKKFVVVVPRTVLETLDAMKKSSMKAREASRWLEAELKRGNRFLRTQKHHEKLSLSPLKYPKKKDKQLWDFYQLLECCNYFCQQSFSASQKPNEKVPIVTLLVSKARGDNGVELDAESFDGVAASIGVKVEDVKAFYSQVFKKSEHGRR